MLIIEISRGKQMIPTDSTIEEGSYCRKKKQGKKF